MVTGPVPEHAVPDFGPARRELRVRLAAGLEAPRRARAALAELDGLVEPNLLPDLKIVVSELVSNAVRYGPGAEVELTLTVHGEGLVRGVVVDFGDPVAAPVAIRAAGADGGWGLRIVDTLCGWWGVREGTTHVWFVLQRA